MQINPILALELRARWRDNRSFLLLLGVALALSLLTGFVYDRAVSDAANLGNSRIDMITARGGVSSSAFNSNDNARLGLVGRELFVALAHANILCWLLIAAASAATGIARERERGLLESLQLSRISARSQIAARFGANLLLLGALQLVLLPIYAVAFIMRGISPAEIGEAFLLVAWASVSGTALGLWFSARAHRPTGALFSALGAIALFSLVVFISNSLIWSLGFGVVGPLQWRHWLGLFHPTALFMALADPNTGWPLEIGDALLIFSSAHFVFCAVLLWGATRGVARNLAPASWGQNSILVDKLRARQVAKPPKSKAAQRASGALLTDIPLDSLVHFADPLLAREVKARFRLRRAGFGLSMVRGALLLLVLSIWIFGVASLCDKQARTGTAPAILAVLLYGGALVLAVLSATSWTRERESGTWESLKLSLLSPREILRAKWLSPLVSFAYYSAPLWILLPVGAFFVRLDALVVGVFLVVVWLSLSVALGLLVSWRVKNGAASIAWTIGILATLLIGAPALDQMVGASETITEWKFGAIAGQGDYAFDPYGGNAVYDDVVAANYKAETGREVPPKPKFSTPGQNIVITPAWTQFQRWGEGQTERAARYRMRLMAWNPTLTLSELPWNVARARTGTDREKISDRLADMGAWLLFGALPPMLTIAFLLYLLRRDVRREQLGL